MKPENRESPEQQEPVRTTTHWKRIHVGVLIWLVVIILLMAIFSRTFG